MPRASSRRWAAVMVISLAAVSLAAAQVSPYLQDILRKNIEASGGKAKLAQVKTLSFRTGGTLNFVSSSGEFKAVSGMNSRGLFASNQMLLPDTPFEYPCNPISHRPTFTAPTRRSAGPASSNVLKKRR